jgi:hypothetical protein
MAWQEVKDFCEGWEFWGEGALAIALLFKSSTLFHTVLLHFHVSPSWATVDQLAEQIGLCPWHVKVEVETTYETGL